MDTTVGILLGKGPMSCHACHANPFKLVIQQLLRIPQQWKTSSVVPIPKSSTNIDDPHNYRPISLLPVIRKLLERHVYRLVSQHLAERKLISDTQWGLTHLIASRRRQLHFPRTGLIIGNDILELVDCYPYLAVLVTSKISWADQIEHICCKARRLVSMLYRQLHKYNAPYLCHLHSSTLRV